MAQSQTLLQASIGAQSWLVQALAVLGGSALIALGAQVSVPMLPVPMTLQTLAVVLVGPTAGSRLGAGAVIAYLVEGALGLPVFAGGGAGLGLAGRTDGGLPVRLCRARLGGGCAGRTRPARGLVGTFVSVLMVSALLYVPGVLWLTAATPLDLGGAVTRGMVPFLLGDTVKAAIAALVVTGGWTRAGLAPRLIVRPAFNSRMPRIRGFRLSCGRRVCVPSPFDTQELPMSDTIPSLVRRTPWPKSASRPVVTPLQMSVVYASPDPDTLDAQYMGTNPGFTYAREGHPNASVLAQKIDMLEGVDGASSPARGWQP